MSTTAPGQKIERTYCSEQGIESAMLGTADRVDVWLLLEYAGTWSTKALADASIGASLQTKLEQLIAQFAEQGLRLRPQLIRQPERDNTGESLQLFLSGRDRCVQVAANSYAEFERIDFLQAFNTASDCEPVYFVCTNGQRDLCCARFGLPVYRRLRELVGDRVWQATHLGGHRYAPNLLVAPQNLLYGRVGLDSVDRFVTQVEAGGVSFEHLRGRTAYPQAVQAAEGLLARQGLKLLRVGSEADEPGQKIEVEFADAQARHQISVQRAPEAQMILASCGDTATKPFHPFEPVPTLG